VLAATLVAGLLGSLRALAPEPQRASDPAAGERADPSAVPSDRRRLRTWAHLLVTGERVWHVDVDGRRVNRLDLPGGFALPGRNPVVSGYGGAVLGASQPAGSRAADTPAYGVTAQGMHRLGTAERLVPSALSGSVWLVRREAGSRIAQRVDFGGAPASRPYRLPPGRTLLAELLPGLLLGPASPGTPGPIDLLDRHSGRIRPLLAGPAVVRSARGTSVLWSPCTGAPCGLLHTQAHSGRTQRISRWPAGVAASGAALLSPDGRHYAAAGRQGTREVLVLGHVPGDGREQSINVVGQRRAARALAYGSDGRLYAADGDQLTIIGGGPHDVTSMPLALPGIAGLAVS